MSLSPFPDARFPTRRELQNNYLFDCAWCERKVSSDRGHLAHSAGADPRPENASNLGLLGISAVFVFCPNCTRPTYIEGVPLGPEVDPRLSIQVPAPSFGEDLAFLPNHVQALYTEARACLSIKAYTAAAHVCRKLLLNIAIVEGLPPPHNVTFAAAIDYLDKQNVIPRNTKGLLDRIRKIGNEAAHELTPTPAADAEAALFLTTAMLRNLYHLPEVAKSTG